MIKGKFGFPTDSQCWLKKSQYGLVDAPARWRERLVQVLKNSGARPLENDSSVFVWEVGETEKTRMPIDEDVEKIWAEEKFLFKQPRRIIAVAVLHVEDCMVAASKEFYEKQWKQIIGPLRVGTFECAKSGFVFCGKRVLWDEGTLRIGQAHYAENLAELDVDGEEDGSKNFVKTTRNGRCAYRQAIGGLRWLEVTRPDLAFGISVVSSRTENPTHEDAKETNKVIREAKEHKRTELVFRRLSKCQIVVFCDASFQNREGKKSQGALIVCIGEMQ